VAALQLPVTNPAWFALRSSPENNLFLDNESELILHTYPFLARLSVLKVEINISSA
jgi:hypothetical protein